MNHLLRADMICKAGIQRKKFPYLRKGQVIITEASKIDADRVLLMLAAGNYDCFYDDSKIEDFLDKFCEE